jgi:hypothetical protein
MEDTMKCPKCQFENLDDARFFIESGPDVKSSKEILQLISENLNPVEMDIGRTKLMQLMLR